MKKEKLFKIGIINESTVDVVKDMTTFYTSDTELWLGFELSEEGVEFDSAEILLFNIDNKSFVVRSVVKTADKYWYELDMDMIAHHGEWKAQLQFTKNNEVYTSKHFDFRIENDLSDERPPKLIDITNWSNIKQTADSLIAEMKVAVTEAIEAESERQTTFEANESERNDTFNANEDIRQTQEFEREKAETQRQTTFENNESIRTDTFNVNEGTRQENEIARQQAESERQSQFETAEQERQNSFEIAEQSRQSAEDIRVENEEQRISNYENMQENIDMIGKVKLLNIVENGDFSNGLTGLTPILSSRDKLSIENGMLRVESLTNKQDLGFYFKTSGLTNGNKYYISVSLDLSSELPQSVYVRSISPKLENLLVASAIEGTLSAIGSTTVDSTSQYMSLNGDKGVEPYYYHVKSIQFIDLTNIFGHGNEPTKATMDWIVNQNGYFDELVIKRDDIQQYELNQLRKAVIALGGTI